MEIRRLQTLTRLGLWDCDLSPDGQAVAAVYQEDEGPQLGVWRTRGCDWLHELALPGTPIAGPTLPERTPVPTYARPRFSPDGRRLAAARREGSGLTVWSLEQGKAIFEHAPDRGAVVAAHAFGPDGQTVVLAQGDLLQTWSVDEGRWLTALAMPAEVTSLRTSADGRLLGVGLQAGGAAVVDLEAQEVVARRPEIEQPVTALGFHPGQRWLLAATAPSFDTSSGRRQRTAHGWAHLWNYVSGEEVARIPCDYQAVLLGGGEYLATLTDTSRSLWVWHIARDEVAAYIDNVVPEAMVDDERGFEGRSVSLAATPAGDVLAVAGLSRPFSAVGVLRLYAFQAEAVPQP